MSIAISVRFIRKKSAIADRIEIAIAIPYTEQFLYGDQPKPVQLGSSRNFIYFVETSSPNLSTQ